MRPLGSPSPEQETHVIIRKYGKHSQRREPQEPGPVHKGVKSALGEVHQNICSGSILQKTPCLEQLKLEEAEIWTRLWEEVGGG